MSHTAQYRGTFTGYDGQMVVLYAAVNDQTGVEDDSASYCAPAGDPNYEPGSAYATAFAAALVTRADAATLGA